MDSNTNFSPQESLQLIEGMIKKAQSKFAENGHLYLLWGWVVFTCSILQFILLHFLNYQQHYWVWMITWVVFIYQIFYLKKHKKQRTVKTYYDELVGYVWITFVVLMFLISFILGRLGQNINAYFLPITPILLALYGMPVFLSGIILRYQPLIIGGIGCWVLSMIANIISQKIPSDFEILFVPVAMLIAWIIPGYLMRKKYLTTN
ncbi:MAG: hypothetical protein H7068_03510 [Pedobacter sp.]|nr:hypothetical protein [Chitinophagaceae bacterium]